MSRHPTASSMSSTQSFCRRVSEASEKRGRYPVMRNVLRMCLSAAFVWAAVSGSTASAQTNPWSVSFDIGAQVAVNGDVHSDGSGTVLGLPTQVTAKSYGDVYGTGFYWAAGLGYRVAEQ